MDINSRNLGQQEEDLDKKKFRKRASMSRPTGHCHGDTVSGGPASPVFVSIQIVMNYIINTSMSLKISSKIWLQDKRRRSW